MSDNLSCSENTKKKIAYALKELMQVMPFEKITIADITKKCNIHRQTFYYHFQDRYELLDWLLNKEIISSFVEDLSLVNFEDKLYTMLNTIYNDKKFYQNAVKINMTDVFTYFSRLSMMQMLTIVDKNAEENEIYGSDGSHKAIAEFFGFGLGGMIICWINHGMKEEPKELIKNIKNYIDEYYKILERK